MSESSVPFQGSSAPPVPVDDTEPAGGRNTKLLLAGGGAFLVLAAVLAYFLLFAGGGAEEPSADAAGSQPVAPSVPGEPAVSEPAPVQRLNAKSFGRNPFKALIVEAPAVVEAPVVAPPVTSPTTSGATGIPGVTTPPSTGTEAPSTSSSHSFRVVGVAPDNSTITVKVDGKRYSNLRAGEVFATFFKVRLIGGATNVFQYGDTRFNTLGDKRLTIA